MAKISVIVPVYNAQEHLDQCVRSLVEQTCADIEILLINDGSTDNSKQICQSWVARDSRVRLADQTNGGVSSARNAGIERASGTYLCFVDADDFVDPRYCEVLLSRMTPDTDMVVTGLRQFNAAGSRVLNHRLASGTYTTGQMLPIVIDDGTLSGFTLYSPCGVLYRNEIIRNYHLRFREKVYYNEDGLFNVEYFLHCSQNIYVDYHSTFYFYRVNEQSATKTADLFSPRYLQSMDEVERVLRQYAARFPDEISGQLLRRRGTVAFAQIRYVAKTTADRKKIRELLWEPTFRESLKKVRFFSFSGKKKLIYVLLRTKCTPLLLLCLKAYHSSKRI